VGKGETTGRSALAQYWANRRRRGPPAPLNTINLRLLKAQNGRCPLCLDLLLHADSAPQSPYEWELWQGAIRRAITKQNLLAQPQPRHTG
jgi:RNA-directed DNA polymerase